MYKFLDKNSSTVIIDLFSAGYVDNKIEDKHILPVRWVGDIVKNINEEGVSIIYPESKIEHNPIKEIDITIKSIKSIINKNKLIQNIIFIDSSKSFDEPEITVEALHKFPTSIKLANKFVSKIHLQKLDKIAWIDHKTIIDPDLELFNRKFRKAIILIRFSLNAEVHQVQIVQDMGCILRNL